MKGFKGISFLILMGLMLVLAACGGGDDESSASEDQSSSSDTSEKVVLEASNWDFDQEEYQAKAGDVTIELVNAEGMHGITIDELDGFELEGEGSKTVELEAGEYTVRCSIPCGQGHADMVTTIQVS